MLKRLESYLTKVTIFLLLFSFDLKFTGLSRLRADVKVGADQVLQVR